MTSDSLIRYLTQRTSKMDRRNRLHVRSTGEIIDLAARVYQTLGWTFLKLTVVPSLFCLAAVTFFFRYVLPAYFLTKSPGSESAQVLEMAATTALAVFVAAPLLLLGASYTSAVVSSLVSDHMLGNAPDPAAAEAVGRRLFGRLFLLSLRIVLIASAGMVVAIGLMALAGHVASITAESDATAGLILLGAWLAFAAAFVGFLFVLQRYALAPAALVLEKTGISEACRRSAFLLRASAGHSGGGGAVWSVYLLLLILLVPVWGGISASLDLINYPDSVQAQISGFPFAGALVEALGLLPMFLVLWTLTPVWAATMTILYFDRRIRLEGYDIEALAEDVWHADRSRRFEL